MEPWYYDKDTKIITTPEANYKGHPKGLGHFLYEGMRAKPDAIAQFIPEIFSSEKVEDIAVDVETGRTQTFAILLDKCIRTAQQIQYLGLKPGDIIATCSYNQQDSIVPFIAATFTGVTHSALDSTQPRVDKKYLLELVKPKLLFASDDCFVEISEIIEELKLSTQIVVFDDTATLHSLNQFIAKETAKDDFEVFIPNDCKSVAIILFSSGTTGYPKGICLNHNFLTFHSESLRQMSSIMVVVSLYWVSTTAALIATMAGSNTFAYTRKFNSEMAWKHIEDFEIKMMFLTPYNTNLMVDNIPEGHISTLLGICVAGSAIAPERMKRARELMPKTLVGNFYAQTETGTVFFYFNPIMYESLTCVGMPRHSYAYKIVDTETEENKGFNEPGELRVKSEFCTNGYYNQDSSDCWDDEGFFKTGDVAYYDEKFRFYITDRKKEMFKYRGFHVVPAKIEAILGGHPDVELGVVLGIPHPDDDFHALAVVLLKANSEVTADEIKNYVNTRVDEREQIRQGVVFVKDIPFTPTGKVKRAVMKSMYLDGTL